MSSHLLVLALALAFGGANDARQKLDDANGYLLHLEDEKAAAAAREGILTHPPDQLGAQLLVSLGLARFNLLDTEGARKAFHVALKLDPSVWPPDFANPRAMVLFGEERAHESLEPRRVLARHLAYGLTGFAVVTAGTGVAFGLSAREARVDAIRSPRAEQAQGWWSVSRGRATAANALFVSAGALALTGAGLFIYSLFGGGPVTYAAAL